jgi:hypothetical protein
MKKTCNKLLAFVLALAMALSVSVVAFASETTAPTSSTTVTALDGIASVNVEGVDAYYQYDDNTGSSVKYIRAKLGATKTWENLQSARVAITTTGAVPTVAGATATSSTGNEYIYTLNLLNTRYAVTVGSNTYYLAAGFEKNIALSANDVDPLAITVSQLGSSTTGINVYGSVVQNNYMGNTYYVNNGTNWTDTNVAYYISGTYTWLGDSTSVTANIGKNAAATLGGNYSNGTIDLTVNRPTVTVAYNGQTRSYIVTAVLDTTTSFRVSASTYAINFDELNDSEYADEFETNVAQIETALNAYYAKGKVFAATDSVMDVMKDFISFAQSTYFTGTTNCSDTYLATLNGLGEFSAGQMSGWCYMDGAYTPTCKVPMVGAADYALGNAPLFTWFLTVDYTPHF